MYIPQIELQSHFGQKQGTALLIGVKWMYVRDLLDLKPPTHRFCWGCSLGIAYWQQRHWRFELTTLKGQLRAAINALPSIVLKAVLHCSVLADLAHFSFDLAVLLIYASLWP